jgi:hypothetical protein
LALSFLFLISAFLNFNLLTLFGNEPNKLVPAQ